MEEEGVYFRGHALVMEGAHITQKHFPTDGRLVKYILSIYYITCFQLSGLVKCEIGSCVHVIMSDKLKQS